MAKSKRVETVEDLSDWMFLRTMYETFGARRSAELMGWAVLFAFSGVKDFRALREEMEARGMAQRTSYRALADFKKLRGVLEAQLERPVAEAEVLENIPAEITAKMAKSSKSVVL